MVQINFGRREVTCKLVYYGPGLSGKTTNIEQVHALMPQQSRGELTSIATEGERTLFFDFLPLDLGEVAGMQTKFQLYTVPGQVYYNGTRKLVLSGADGVVFVADSDPAKKVENVESFQNLQDNLHENGVDMSTIPLVIQFNKRDLPGDMPVPDLNQLINRFGSPTTEAIAFKGEGVLVTLKTIARLVLDNLNKEYAGKGTGTRARMAAVSAGAAPAPSATLPSPGVATATAPAPVAAPVAAARPTAAAPPVAPAPKPAPAATAVVPPVAPKPVPAAPPAAVAPAPTVPAHPPMPEAAKEPPKFVPKSPSKPQRTMPTTTPAASESGAGSPADAEGSGAKSGGMTWVFVALAVIGLAAAAYFIFVR